MLLLLSSHDFPPQSFDSVALTARPHADTSPDSVVLPILKRLGSGPTCTSPTRTSDAAEGRLQSSSTSPLETLPEEVNTTVLLVQDVAAPSPLMKSLRSERRPAKRFVCASENLSASSRSFEQQEAEGKDGEGRRHDG